VLRRSTACSAARPTAVRPASRARGTTTGEGTDLNSARLALFPGLRLGGGGGAAVSFELDYLLTGHAEIYVGQSRHWVVAWLWFLS
jgi:hypothetical protein